MFVLNASFILFKILMKINTFFKILFKIFLGFHFSYLKCVYWLECGIRYNWIRNCCQNMLNNMFSGSIAWSHGRIRCGYVQAITSINVHDQRLFFFQLWRSIHCNKIIKTFDIRMRKVLCITLSVSLTPGLHLKMFRIW